MQEVLFITDRLRELISDENLDKEDLKKAVYDSDTTTLLQDALQKVIDGRTTFKEIYRAVDIDFDLEKKIRQNIRKEEREKEREAQKRDRDDFNSSIMGRLDKIEDKVDKLYDYQSDNAEAIGLIFESDIIQFQAFIVHAKTSSEREAFQSEEVIESGLMENRPIQNRCAEFSWNGKLFTVNYIIEV